ncbi:hypothetical protein GF406_09100 [candidate division KSB1 bacterium]|nr:hypothetical protein [candidate division KSB1 bacterium]
MPRANRHFLPGYIWHITHRCHNRDFLFKHRIDRHRWIQELGEAKRRYKLRILNYIATSNHIHLLVFNPDETAVPLAMQRAAGQTAEHYNQRRNRTGAFWNDRYHATAIDKEHYLWQCMLYIHLNMVRAGVVKHPDQWFPSAYTEIQSPKKRYELLSWPDLRFFRVYHSS